MVIMVFLNIPLYVIFHREQVLDSKYGGLTIGNMGQAEANCDKARISSSEFYLECVTGTISAFPYFGLQKYGSDAEQKSVCGETERRYDTGLTGCESFRSQSSPLFKEKLLPCLGKQKCTVPKAAQAIIDRESECTAVEDDYLYV